MVTMELFENLPKPRGDKKVLRELADKERTAIVPSNFVFVQTTEQLQDCIAAIQDARRFAFDTETTGLDWRDYVVCIGIAVSTKRGVRCWSIPTNMVYAMRNFEPSEVRDAFADVFESPEIAKVAHNAKFDMHKMKNTFGIDVVGLTDDTMIAQTILNENESHALEDIAKKWIDGYRAGWKFKQDGHFGVWPIKMATIYLSHDVETTLAIYDWQQTIFAQHPKLRALYYDVEMPSVQIAYEMEQHGIGWDADYYETIMKPTVQSAMEEAKAKCHAVLGPINLNAPLQVSTALFDGLGLERLDGNSVNKKVLAKLRSRHPVIVDFEAYRKWATLDKMFVRELPDHVVAGRIHPSFRTCINTGRWACTNPNLQQLPKAAVGPLIRRGFIPSTGCVLVAIDYSQIELRWLADISGDEALIAAFEAGVDIHSATCVRMFPHAGLTIEFLAENKDHPLRVRAKTINFGILFGMGPGLLMDTINAQTKDAADHVDVEDCKGLIAQWYAAFPKAKSYINAMKTLAFKQGYVETVLGRKRRLPDARSNDRMLSSMAERQAVNSPIQGSAADLLKVAMIKIRAFLKATNYPFTMLLAIHDELLFEVPKAWLRRHGAALKELSEVMRTAMVIRVPIEVSVDVLSRWGDKSPPDDNLDLDSAA